jgi:shikimate kinase
MSASIVLIGPSRAGKTTLAKLLGEALNLPALDLDELRWQYYAEIGYEKTQERAAIAANGLKGLLAFWKPFTPHAIERVLQEYPLNHVIAFGGWHTVMDDEAGLQRAIAALAPFPQVILLLPAPDEAETFAILSERYRRSADHMTEGEFDAMLAELRPYMHHPALFRLAKQTIYTGRKSPDEVCAEIIDRSGGGHR